MERRGGAALHGHAHAAVWRGECETPRRGFRRGGHARGHVHDQLDGQGNLGAFGRVGEQQLDALAQVAQDEMRAFLEKRGVR